MNERGRFAAMTERGRCLIRWFCRAKKRPGNGRTVPRESLVLVDMVFALFPNVGGTSLAAAGNYTSRLTAFYESASDYTPDMG